MHALRNTYSDEVAEKPYVASYFAVISRDPRVETKSNPMAVSSIHVFYPLENNKTSSTF